VKRIICFMALAALLPAVARASDTDRDAYAGRLTALLRAGQMESGDRQARLLNESERAFVNFAQEYPDSIYADDSLFVYSLIEFMGAALVPPRDMDTARQMIVMMDRMAAQYPGGRLEPLTYSVLERELGQDGLSGSFYMPYGCVVSYMRAVLCGAERNYMEAIQRYNELRLCLRPIEDERIAAEVYIPLFRAYLKTERSASAQAIADEVSQLFPGSRLQAILRSESGRE